MALWIESVSAEYNGGECIDGLEALRLVALDLSVNTDARDWDRLAREVERLLAASNDGVEPEPKPVPEALAPHRGRERELDCEWGRCACFITSICSSSRNDESSTLQPTFHATSSTIAIVQRLEVERSRQPSSTSSAPRPMLDGTLYAPILIKSFSQFNGKSSSTDTCHAEFSFAVVVQMSPQMAVDR